MLQLLGSYSNGRNESFELTVKENGFSEIREEEESEILLFINPKCTDDMVFIQEKYHSPLTTS